MHPIETNNRGRLDLSFLANVIPQIEFVLYAIEIPHTMYLFLTNPTAGRNYISRTHVTLITQLRTGGY